MGLGLGVRVRRLALPHHARRVRLELGQLELSEEHRVGVARGRVAREVHALAAEALLHLVRVRVGVRGRVRARARVRVRVRACRWW